MDLRGFGKSHTEKKIESINDLSDDVNNLVQRVLVNGEGLTEDYLAKNMTTIGWSLGGAITLQLAVNFPNIY